LNGKPGHFLPTTLPDGGFMRINVIALSVAAALLWGAAILIVASANLIWPGYGGAFLELAASIYPGYDPGHGIGSVITATLYGLVDAAIAGAVFGWLYNFLSRKFPDTPGAP
jgi:hypothetical protein